MGNKKEALLDDVRFVFSECERIADVVQERGIKALSRDDIAHTIPHTSGKDRMLCGKLANAKITTLAEKVARIGDLHGRVDLNTLREEVAELLVSRFLREQRELDVKQLDRVMSSAIKAARSCFVTRTHYIPCHLMANASEPERLKIGPVTFHSRSSFRKLLLMTARAREVRSKGNGGEAQRHRVILARAVRYYRNFQWVAAVTISDCDDHSSIALAQEAITAALNCLHLILGVRNTGKMRIGGTHAAVDRRAKLASTSDGSFVPTLSVAGFGQVGYPKGWSKRLDESEFQHFVMLCSVALEAAVDPGLDRPLSHRFLDAVQWFGEACRDESPATRTVKFVTALERMLMTEEQDDISSLVAERVAALCFSDVEPRAAWRAKTKAAYDLRSHLVHGSMSPRDPEVRRGATIAAEVAEAALQCGLDAFGIAGLRDKELASRKLARWFQDVVTWAEGTEAILDSNVKSSVGADAKADD